MSGSWQVQDAKARFSEFLSASLTEGPQIVTRRGVQTAVLIPVDEWRRLKRAAGTKSQSAVAGTGGAHRGADGTEKARAPAPAAVFRLTVYLLDTNVVSELRRPKPHRE